MEINKEELAELITTTEGFLVVDFWAAWCGPCRMLGKYLPGFAEDNPDMILKKIEVDKNEGVSQEYGVRALPTLIFFKDGEEVGRLSGAQNMRTLQAELDKHKGE